MTQLARGVPRLYWRGGGNVSCKGRSKVRFHCGGEGGMTQLARGVPRLYWRGGGNVSCKGRSKVSLQRGGGNNPTCKGRTKNVLDGWGKCILQGA